MLLISPFWISYLMRIYAWQSLLQPDGYINDLGGCSACRPIIWIGADRSPWSSGSCTATSRS